MSFSSAITKGAKPRRQFFAVERGGRIHDLRSLEVECNLEFPGRYLLLDSLAQVEQSAPYLKLKPCLDCSAQDDMNGYGDSWAAGRGGGF